MANEPAKKDNGNVAENATGRIATRFRDWVQAQAAQAADEGGWEVTARQLDRILSATTAEEIDAADDAITYQGRDLAGLQMRVPDQEYRYAESSDEFETPLGVYIQFKAIALNALPTRGISAGDELLISTGAPLIIGKLRSYQANGMLPVQQEIHAVKTSKGSVLKMKTIPAVTGSVE